MDQSKKTFKSLAIMVSTLTIFVMVITVGTVLVTLADNPDQGEMKLAFNDVTCVQQCNAEVCTCKFGCDEGLRVCMEGVGKAIPCSGEKNSCYTGCTNGHNSCVSHCPEK